MHLRRLRGYDYRCRRVRVRKLRTFLAFGAATDPSELERHWSTQTSRRYEGWIVFTACSHAGVVNVLNHAGYGFPDVAPHAVMGGFHLASANERIIPERLEAMKGFNLRTIAAGHCTGWRALAALVSALETAS